MVKKFEYKIFHTDGTLEELNILGDDGWEVTGVRWNGSLLLMREKAKKDYREFIPLRPK